jgi:hypothetical protein
MEKRRNLVVLCACACGIVERLTEQGLQSEYGVYHLSVSTSDTSESFAPAIEGRII